MPYQGPLSAATFADDAGVGTVAWSNPSNAVSSDDSYATATSSGTQTSHYLKATNFGFSIPTGATISGIFVEIERKSPDVAVDSTLKLSKAGTISGDNKASGTNWVATEAYFTYGSSVSLWGLTWTAADINDTGFGVALSVLGNNAVASVDHIRITVFYDVVHWGLAKGFNFRFTSGYVTDGPNEAYVLTATAYPTTRIVGGETVTFGWTLAPGSSLDVDSTVDRRLAGYGEYSQSRNFRVEIPFAGLYDFRLAVGLCNSSGQNQPPWQEVKIRDGDAQTERFSIGPHSVNGGSFYDAADQLLTTAEWPSRNLPARIIVSGGYVDVVFFTDNATHSFYVAHVQFTRVNLDTFRGPGVAALITP